MHELSVAHALVNASVEALSDDDGTPLVAVQEVHVRLGVMSGVVRGSLEFAFDVAVEGTALAGSTLVVREVPVSVFCSGCDIVVELPGTTSFVCPVCQTPSGDLRSGREVELVRLVLLDAVDEVA
ncbi:MAG: hydrogenase maturation nickel metallochaperone HypA [Actinomycetes bacterium]